MPTLHHDWIEEIEFAEPSAPPPRAGLTLGVPLVAAALGLAMGAVGASMWWAQQQPPTPAEARPVAKVVSAPAAAAPPAAPAVQITPALTAPVVAPPEATAAAAPAPRTEEAVVTLAPPAAGPPALSAEEVARRKERAWARFYKRPAACDGNPSADQLIECGNHFIRAKREFDERWRTGTL